MTEVSQRKGPLPLPALPGEMSPYVLPGARGVNTFGNTLRNIPELCYPLLCFLIAQRLAFNKYSAI